AKRSPSHALLSCPSGALWMITVTRDIPVLPFTDALTMPAFRRPERDARAATSPLFPPGRHERRGGPIDLLLAGGTPDRQAQRAAGALVPDAHGTQDAADRYVSGVTGRPDRRGHPVIELLQQAAAIYARQGK